MVKVHMDVNEIQDGDSCDFETYADTLETSDLIGAEVLEAIHHEYADRNELDELKLKLRDGRVIRICGDNLEPALWSDDNESCA